MVKRVKSNLSVVLALCAQTLGLGAAHVPTHELLGSRNPFFVHCLDARHGGGEGGLFAVVVLQPLDGGDVTRPAPPALLRVAVGGGAAGRHAAAAADAAIVGGGQEIVARDDGGGGRGLADADAAVVVLLEAGLQLRHLGHRRINAGAGNALRIGDMIGLRCKHLTGMF